MKKRQKRYKSREKMEKSNTLLIKQLLKSSQIGVGGNFSCWFCMGYGQAYPAQGYPPPQYPQGPPPQYPYQGPPPPQYGQAPQKKKKDKDSGFVEGCLAMLCCCCLLEACF
ncbi:unnamed protein product [Brassica oleracea]|uniref:(rape) hypothetical protein n=1 Tax=Brassica napus TaxID=3708 RepID=A0A816RKN1_BRANA|nr:unnamed protein product [Brassica napus]